MVDKESVLKIANQVRRRYDKGDLTNDLDCKCAIVSASLSVALHRRRIKHRIHYAGAGWGCHVFVVVDGYLLDLTAKQFNDNIEPIVFRPLEKREREWYWKTKYTFANAKELIRFQHKTDWPEDQIHPKLG